MLRPDTSDNPFNFTGYAFTEYKSLRPVNSNPSQHAHARKDLHVKIRFSPANDLPEGLPVEAHTGDHPTALPCLLRLSLG
jgi:hypothetical protein